MNPQQKPTPEKYCSCCGKRMERRRYASKLEDLGAFMRRKYCSRKCMRKGFVKTDAAQQSNRSAHDSARKIVYLIEERPKVCSVCGSTVNVDIHHADGDYRNNASSNLVLLCRSCHMKAHRPKSVCRICGKAGKTSQGLCDKHYLRFKKYGDPLHEPWSTYKERASKGPVLQYSPDGKLIATYTSLRDAAKHLQIPRSSITNACNGQRKTLRGCIWRYADNPNPFFP